MVRKALLLLCASLPCYAGDIVVSQFKGLNSQDTPATLPDGYSPSLLNVDITPGGLSVKTRQGFGVYKTFTTSTSPAHGGYHFQDSSGNDIQIWGADSYQSIFNGLDAIQISTMAFGATIHCADSQGSAYCLNTNREIAIKTAGTVATTSFQQGIPLGTMLTFTPTRLVASGVSGTPNSIFFSSATIFTSFTTGVTEFDPFTEVIASPGSRITHIRYACGKVLWWKDQSFGYLIGDDQFSLENVIVTPDIGTLDDSSAQYNGIVYFRGQDNHVYQYDCANVTRLSREITPTVQAAGRRKSNSWTQSSQSDFAAGLSSPTQNLSTSLSPGDVIVSSFSASEYSSATGWGSGTSSNFAVGTSSLSLLTNNSGNVTDNGFESASVDYTPNWTRTLTGSDNGGVLSTLGTANCTFSPNTGSNFGYLANFTESSPPLRAKIVSPDESITIAQTSISFVSSVCSWQSSSISSSGNVGKRFKLKFDFADGTSVKTNTSYILGGDISFKYLSDTNAGGYLFAIDTILNGSSTITSGSFTSKLFDTGFTSSTVQLGVSWSANTSTPTFSVLHASATTSVSWPALTSSSGTSTFANRYLRYVSTLSIGSSDNAITAISSVTLLSRSSGTYYSAVNYSPSATSWGTFSLTDSVVGGSTITYYVRSSTSQFIVGSSTPTWVLQTNGATVASSTGTYMQLRSDFRVSAATETPTLGAFTFNWYEGNASDKAYIEFFNDNLWVSVSSGTGGTNNQIQRWDTLNQTWLLDNIPANGFVVDQGRFYLGSPTTGKVHLFGQSIYTDNGASIYSFWKSRDFVGADPWVNNEYISADFILKQSSANVTYTYTVDTSTPTDRTLNLYDGVRSIVRRSINLPAGKVGILYSMMISATSDKIWELLGHRVKYNSQAWKTQ